MYAIVTTGGKQYEFTPGQEYDVEKLTAEVGAEVIFEQVSLLKQDEKVAIGAPYLDKVKVMAKVVDHFRGKKINIIKLKRRKHHMKRQGHRQYYTRVLVTEVKAA